MELERSCLHLQVLAEFDDRGRTENAGVERRTGMNCRELAKKKSVNPLWVKRVIGWVREILVKPEQYPAHFILSPEKHRKAGDKSRTGV
jgi:hypothetical protein